MSVKMISTNSFTESAEKAPPTSTSNKRGYQRSSPRGAYVWLQGEQKVVIVNYSDGLDISSFCFPLNSGCCDGSPPGENVLQYCEMKQRNFLRDLNIFNWNQLTIQLNERLSLNTVRKQGHEE
ncbi:unnamed protein product [Soboliphyme baturini]|uniref:Ovule protein n=1 Tax=Soboliphyme baturini TaxID=241478 RepID=A0A183IHI9_9BILA|nr:unnamed protein product [Soboliphyme baturini]